MSPDKKKELKLELEFNNHQYQRHDSKISQLGMMDDNDNDGGSHNNNRNDDDSIQSNNTSVFDGEEESDGDKLVSDGMMDDDDDEDDNGGINTGIGSGIVEVEDDDDEMEDATFFGSQMGLMTQFDPNSNDDESEDDDDDDVDNDGADNHSDEKNNSDNGDNDKGQSGEHEAIPNSNVENSVSVGNEDQKKSESNNTMTDMTNQIKVEKEHSNKRGDADVGVDDGFSQHKLKSVSVIDEVTMEVEMKEKENTDANIEQYVSVDSKLRNEGNQNKKTDARNELEMSIDNGIGTYNDNNDEMINKNTRHDDDDADDDDDDDDAISMTSTQETLVFRESNTSPPANPVNAKNPFVTLDSTRIPTSDNNEINDGHSDELNDEHHVDMDAAGFTEDDSSQSACISKCNDTNTVTGTDVRTNAKISKMPLVASAGNGAGDSCNADTNTNRNGDSEPESLLPRMSFGELETGFTENSQMIDDENEPALDKGDSIGDDRDEHCGDESENNGEGVSHICTEVQIGANLNLEEENERPESTSDNAKELVESIGSTRETNAIAGGNCPASATPPDLDCENRKDKECENDSNTTIHEDLNDIRKSADMLVNNSPVSSPIADSDGEDQRHTDDKESPKICDKVGAEQKEVEAHGKTCQDIESIPGNDATDKDMGAKERGDKEEAVENIVNKEDQEGRNSKDKIEIEDESENDSEDENTAKVGAHSLSLFMGDTQSIPSQFPITMQEGEDEESKNLEKLGQMHGASDDISKDQESPIAPSTPKIPGNDSISKDVASGAAIGSSTPSSIPTSKTPQCPQSATSKSIQSCSAGYSNDSFFHTSTLPLQQINFTSPESPSIQNRGKEKKVSESNVVNPNPIHDDNNSQMDIHSPVQNADPVGNDYEHECEAEKKSKADSAAKIDFTSDGINLSIQLQTPIMIPEDKTSEVSNRNHSQIDGSATTLGIDSQVMQLVSPPLCEKAKKKEFDPKSDKDAENIERSASNDKEDDREMSQPNQFMEDINTESLLQHTHAPNEEPLSYPKDYVQTIGRKQDHDNHGEMKQEPKFLTGGSNMTVTPQSQVLLEPGPLLQPDQRGIERRPLSILNKYSHGPLKVMKRGLHSKLSQDEIADSSDEDDEIIMDESPTQSENSIANEVSKTSTVDNVAQKVATVIGKTSGNTTCSGWMEKRRPKKEMKKMREKDSLDEEEDDRNANTNGKSLTPLTFPDEAGHTRDMDRQNDEKSGVNSEREGAAEELKNVGANASALSPSTLPYDAELIRDIDRQRDERSVDHMDSGVNSDNEDASASCLQDTQEADESDDDVPLSRLKRVSRGIVNHRQRPEVANMSPESQDEEHEFTDDDVHVGFEQSQNTREIHSRLRKLEEFDVEKLTKSIIGVGVPNLDNSAMKKELKKASKQNSALDSKNKILEKENQALRKKLEGVTLQLDKKNVLCAKMKERLDKVQPLLEALQKMGSIPSKLESNAKSKKSPKKKSTAKGELRRRQKPLATFPDSESEVENEELPKKELGFLTPKEKQATKAKINVVSVSSSSRKVKPKGRAQGNITFSNLWSSLKTYGWKHKSGPEPYSLVYVPPDGSIRIGSKVNIDFFLADDYLWQKAVDLGIIDAPDDEPGVVKIKTTSTFSPLREKLSRQEDGGSYKKKIRNPSIQTKGLGEDDVREDLDNTVLIGKFSILTKRSMDRCASLVKEFLTKHNEARFMRNLFGPLWACLKDEQGSDDDKVCWSFCKSRNAGKLGRKHWFCPPKSKGAKERDGKDYFRTEEAVAAHVLRELKGCAEFIIAFGADDTTVNHFEIKLSRAIEQHVTFDDIKDTSMADSRRGKRRKSILTPTNNEKKTCSTPKRHKKESHQTDVPSSEGGSDVSTVKTSHMKLSAEKPMIKKKSKHSESANKAVSFSQNAVQGAEILVGLNKNSAVKSSSPNNNSPKCGIVATSRGIKKLLQFRSTKTSRKRKLDNVEKLSKKREKMSVSPENSTEIHLTQVPEDDVSSTSFYSPSTRRSKQATDKSLPLHGMSFFGSGVDKKVKKTVHCLGGQFLDDISGDALQKANVHRKLFFISDVKNRRTHKYILACALGVPMLSTGWLQTLESDFNEYQKDRKTSRKVPSAFDSQLYSHNRLPLGLSDASGLFVLQRARHAKKWSRPTCEKRRTLIFEGVTVAIALENDESAKKWADVVRAVGAKTVDYNQIDRKDVTLDFVLVDALSMPPHVTAIPSKVGKTLNRASAYQPKAIVVDLAWATQCIVQRNRLSANSHKRYQIIANKSSQGGGTEVEIYSLKVDKARYEVGDSVTFGKKSSKLSHGRIVSIKHNTRSKKNAVVVKILELHKGFELMEGSSSALTVSIDSSELQGHIVILGGKDFSDISWNQGSNIYVQKKA